MLDTLRQKTLQLSIFWAFVFLLMLALPILASAQSDGQDCDLPDFRIVSDQQIYAIAGEQLSYYVVTADDSTEYSLTSTPPAGLSFSGGLVSGTPSQSGDYVLTFTASNDCGDTTQTVNLSVAEAGASGTTQQDDSGSSADTGSGSELAQNSGQESVGLNEVPETGLAPDNALTVGFYLLALFFISGWIVTRFNSSPELSVIENSSNQQYYGSNQEVEEGRHQVAQSTKQRRFIDGVRR